MLSKFAKKRAQQAFKKLNPTVEDPTSFNEEDESVASLFKSNYNRKKKVFEASTLRKDITIDKFSDGLTEIVLEAYCFDEDKVDSIRENTKENVKRFITKLFNEDLISVNDIRNNPSMVVKIFGEEVDKKIIKSLDMAGKEKADKDVNIDQQMIDDDTKEEHENATEIREQKTHDNNDPTNKTGGIEDDFDEKKNMAYDDSDVKSAESKAQKVIADKVKSKVVNCIKKNIDAAKEAKKRIEDIKEAKDDALTEKMVNEEMEDFDPIRHSGKIDPIHFQTVCDILNEEFLNEELEGQDTDDFLADDDDDEGVSDKEIRDAAGVDSEDELDELDDLDTDNIEDDEEALLMKIVASGDYDYSYREDVMEKVEEHNSKAKTRADTVLLNGIKRNYIKKPNGDTLKNFMNEAMKEANFDPNMLDDPNRTFHEDFAVCNGIIHYTILEALNTMNLIKNEEQKQSIVEKMIH